MTARRPGTALLGVALAVRFACEIGAVVAVGVWGADVTDGPASVVISVVAMAAVCTVWGLWVAPKSRRRLADPARGGVESLVFIAATAALVASGHSVWALVLAAAAFVSALVSRALGGEEQLETAVGRRSGPGE